MLNSSITVRWPQYKKFSSPLDRRGFAKNCDRRCRRPCLCHVVAPRSRPVASGAAGRPPCDSSASGHRGKARAPRVSRDDRFPAHHLNIRSAGQIRIKRCQSRPPARLNAPHGHSIWRGCSATSHRRFGRHALAHLGPSIMGPSRQAASRATGRCGLCSVSRSGESGAAATRATASPTSGTRRGVQRCRPP